jgi:tRNA (guanine6-N2)-methyltransferase
MHSNQPVALVARCLRGLEWICAGELTLRLGIQQPRVEHRTVEFEAPLAPEVLAVGSADDVFLLAARVAGLDHRRSALNELRRQVGAVDAEALVAELGRLRPVPPGAPFEVVASFLGRRNYNRYELEEAAGAALEAGTDRPRLPPGPRPGQPSAPLTWRLHLVDQGGFLGLRVPALPLHRRPYRLASRAGTVHPPLARAAALLAGPAPGDLVLDPFCGAGTMLLEAGSHQPDARLAGADLDPEAVRAARANAAGAGRAACWLVADAGRLPLAAGAAGAVLTNPPWRRRVAPGGRLARGLEPFWDEAGRVLGPEGRLVVVLEELEEQLGPAGAAGLAPVLLQRVAVSGAWITLGLLCPPGRREAELERLRAVGPRPPPETGVT